MRRSLPWIFGALGLIAVAVIWEAYKAIGPADGVVVGAVEGERNSGFRILPRTHDRSMPHLWDIAARLFAVTSPGDPAPMWLSVLQAALVTLGIAAIGLLIGLAVGSLLALIMQSWRIAEWGILPWVILSQTVPLIAFAPVLNSIGVQINNSGTPWPQWLSVAIIASYLAFFPIAVGALRGLQSPERAHLELMRTYAAGPLTTLRKLRIPAAVPYLLPALRLGAANAVIGAIVAEVSMSMPGGIGRMIIGLASQASTDPPAPWSPIVGAVAIGLVAAGSVGVLGLILKNYRRGEAAA